MEVFIGGFIVGMGVGVIVLYLCARKAGKWKS